MIIDEEKLKRQEGQVQLWIEGGCQSVLEACTGYGKTFVAILAIKRLQRKYPNAIVDVVVPKIPLYQDWIRKRTGHIELHDLKNVNVFVVNTYIRLNPRDINLLIPDEVHNYASEEFIKVFEVAKCVKKKDRKPNDTMILGLSATLERLDGKHTLIEEYCPVFDTITMAEAKAKGYISNYKIYNLALDFNEKDAEEYDRWDSIFKNSFGKFAHNFGLAMACSYGKGKVSEVEVNMQEERSGVLVSVRKTLMKNSADWQYWWSLQQEWDGERDSMWSPLNISKYGQQFRTSMTNRKSLIFRADVKLEAIVDLVRKFMVKTMIFSEDTVFADRVTETLGEDICMSYHTNIKGRTERIEVIDKKGLISYKDKKYGKEAMKKLILEDFKKPEGILAVSSVRGLIEGYDNSLVRLIVMASYNSSKKANTQTSGRGTRTDYKDLYKNAIIVNLVIRESQEEKWLREKQRGVEDIIWVNSVSDINNEANLFDIELT